MTIILWTLTIMWRPIGPTWPLHIRRGRFREWAAWRRWIGKRSTRTVNKTNLDKVSNQLFVFVNFACHHRLLLRQCWRGTTDLHVIPSPPPLLWSLWFSIVTKMQKTAKHLQIFQVWCRRPKLQVYPWKVCFWLTQYVCKSAFICMDLYTVVAYSLQIACEDFGRMFSHSFSACTSSSSSFFFVEVEISLHTLIPLFMPGSV